MNQSTQTMKNSIESLLLLGIIFFLSSCGGDMPVADFSWSPAIPAPGKDVTFTNLSENAKKYEWDFGDSETDDQPNPLHAYKRPGNYTGVLIARSRGDYDTIAHTVSVLGE